MQQLDMYAETLILRHHAERDRMLEQRRLVREALADHRVRFYQPALVSLGRQMVVWGTQLQRRYDNLSTPSPATPPAPILAAQPK